MKLKVDDFLKNIKEHISKDVKTIGIAGGSGSGKTFVAKKISEALGLRMISLDDYIIPEKIKSSDNWELPEIWDLKLVRENLEALSRGESFAKPCYSFITGEIGYFEDISSDDSYVLEGLYALDDSLADLTDLKIFVDVDENVRLIRRISRDQKTRSENSEQIIYRWENTIQLTFLKYVEPQKERANFVLTS